VLATKVTKVTKLTFDRRPAKQADARAAKPE
jgi:hypothetical protein